MIASSTHTFGPVGVAWVSAAAVLRVLLREK